MTDSTKPNDGGPAFPVPDGEAANFGVHGLSKRDWFAGLALGAVHAGCLESRPRDGQTWAEMVADEAYEIADAMVNAGTTP